MEHLLCWSNIERPSKIDNQLTKNNSRYVSILQLQLIIKEFQLNFERKNAWTIRRMSVVKMSLKFIFFGSMIQMRLIYWFKKCHMFTKRYFSWICMLLPVFFLFIFMSVQSDKSRLHLLIWNNTLFISLHY